MRKLDRYLREFDIFPKLDPSAPRVKTSSSGVVSIVCFILMGYLFFKEVIEYGEPVVTSAVTVDTTRMEMGFLNVTLNMEFPSMPCSYFGIDSVDHLGHVLVDATGPTSDLRKIPIQVENEGAEGCLLVGSFPVRKIRGQFNLASRRHADMFPLMSFVIHGEEGNQHVHTEDKSAVDDKLKFNVTHTIRTLSFGVPVAGVAQPLNGVGYVMPADKYLKVTYFLQIVPSLFYYANGDVIESYHYSVTENKEEEVPAPGVPSIASLQWKYDFSPYTTTYREQAKSFSHFLTRLCAVIGGTYVVFGILSALATRFETATKKDK